jgi:hypothetical protein
MGVGLPPAGVAMGTGVETALTQPVSGSGSICLSISSVCVAASGQQPYATLGAIK